MQSLGRSYMRGEDMASRSGRIAQGNGSKTRWMELNLKCSKLSCRPLPLQDDLDKFAILRISLNSRLIFTCSLSVAQLSWPLFLMAEGGRGFRWGSIYYSHYGACNYFGMQQKMSWHISVSASLATRQTYGRRIFFQQRKYYGKALVVIISNQVSMHVGQWLGLRSAWFICRLSFLASW